MPTIPTPALTALRGKVRMRTASGEVPLLPKATNGRRPDTTPIRAAPSRGRASEGGRVVGGSGQNGRGFVGQTGSGDVYAGKDGNVYKKTDNGWQQYENGGWNSVDTSAAKANANARAAKFRNPRPESRDCADFQHHGQRVARSIWRPIRFDVTRPRTKRRFAIKPGAEPQSRRPSQAAGHSANAELSTAISE